MRATNRECGRNPVCAPTAVQKSTLEGVFEPLQRLEDLGLTRRRCLAFLFLVLDDFFGRVGDEFLVRKLGVDALDVGLGLGQFLVESRLLRRKIDYAF